MVDKVWIIDTQSGQAQEKEKIIADHAVNFAQI